MVCGIWQAYEPTPEPSGEGLEAGGEQGIMSEAKAQGLLEPFGAIFQVPPTGVLDGHTAGLTHQLA